VKEGETLYGVSRLYGVDARAVVKLNNLLPPYKLNTGQTLILPRRAQEAEVTVARATADRDAPPSASDAPENIWRPVAPASAPAPATASPASAAAPQPEAAPESSSPAPTPAPKAAATEIPDASPPRAGTGFQWPLRGRILSRFGVQAGGLHNDGINIAAPRGTPVHAADVGTVAYAGNELGGFGNLLLIKHADGWITAYAHNDEILVKVGERVRRGQVVARVGSTGSANSPQLHFEVRRGERPVDPTALLSGNASVRSTAGPAGRPDPG
jgi:murein DD-endopeptidase MepM/ murein hydrolase activator NlpD